MNLSDEKQLIKNEIEKVNDQFTQQQLIQRALISETQIKNGKTTSLENVKKEIKDW